MEGTLEVFPDNVYLITLTDEKNNVYSLSYSIYNNHGQEFMIPEIYTKNDVIIDTSDADQSVFNNIKSTINFMDSNNRSTRGGKHRNRCLTLKTRKAKSEVYKIDSSCIIFILPMDVSKTNRRGSKGKTNKMRISP